MSRKLYCRAGASLSIDSEIARGGEGIVFSLRNDPHRVVKLYHRPDERRARKLEAMLKSVPHDPWMEKRGQVSICWPQDLALTGSGDVVGFVMPRLDTTGYHKVGLLWNAEDRATAAPGFNWKYLCVAASNFASLMELVHARGHVIGDVNEENILVSSRATATVVDCDSMQVRDPESGVTFRSPVSREAFISPERLGKTLSEVDRNAADDHWALAILVFAMLLEGQHPAHGIGYPPERERRLRLGIFPYLGEKGFSAPRYCVPFEVLSPELSGLFTRCFREGYRVPSRRPSSAEWKRALQLTAAGLTRCSEVETHWFSPHLTSCPWCNERELIGLDRFAPPSHGPVNTPSSSDEAPAQSETVLGRLLRTLFN